MTKYLGRYGHYTCARQIANKHLKPEKLAEMTDNEVIDFLDEKYVFLKPFEGDEKYEEEVILIPRDVYDNIEGIENLHR